MTRARTVLVAIVLVGLVLAGIGATYDSEASLGRAHAFATSSAVTVTDAATTVYALRLYGRGADFCVEVANAGETNALASLEVEVCARDDGQWINYLADTDFQDTGNTNVYFSNSDDDATAVQSLAAGSAGLVQFRCRPCYAVRFRAAAASGKTTTVAVYGTAAEW